MLEPRLWICDWIWTDVPLPTATRRITAETPIMIPSMVSADRRRLERLPAAVGAHAGVDQRHLDVVQGAGPGDEVERLEDEPDLDVADRRQLVVVQVPDVHPVQQVEARCGQVEAADDVHQRALARAG